MQITEAKLVFNERLFKLKDRVKIYHKKKWWSGAVEYFRPWRWRHPKSLYDLAIQAGKKVELVEKENENTFVTYDDYSRVYMYIRTDNRISKTSDLFEGFGIRTSPGGMHVIFEGEEEYTPLPYFSKVEVQANENPNSSNDLPF